MALTQISTAGVKDDAISAGKIPANAVGSSEIADDAVDQGAIADEAVDEARLQISNAGSNGQFLQKQSGNTGGLTWATVSVPDSDKIEEGNTSVETIDTGSDGRVVIELDGGEKARFTGDGLAIGTTTLASGMSANANHLGLKNSANCGMTIIAGDDDDCNINFTDDDRNISGAIKYSNDGDYLSLYTDASERFRVASAGQLGIGGATYGTSGQVLTSGGSGAAPSWTTISAAPTIEATANGSISANEAVIVESDGKVAGITAVSDTTTSSSNLVDTANNGFGPRFLQTAWDDGNSTVVAIWFEHTGNSGQSRINIAAGTLSGNSLTWGSNVVVYEGTARWPQVASVGGNKYLLTWAQDNGQSFGRIATVSGTTVTLHSSTNIGSYTYRDSDLIVLSSTKAVLAFSLNSNVVNYAKVITISGNGISVGSDTAFTGSNNNGGQNRLVKLTSTKFLWTCYRAPYATVYGRVCEVSSSATTPSLGGMATFIDNKGHAHLTIWDSVKNQGAFLWQHTSRSNKICAFKWTYSGTTITANINTITNDLVDGDYQAWQMQGAVSSTSNIFISLKNQSGSPGNQGEFFKIVQDGDTFSASNHVTNFSSGDYVMSGDSRTQSSTVDLVGPNKFLVLWGTYKSGQNWLRYFVRQYPATDLTLENFIGFSSAAYTNGQTAKINVVGNTTTQSSLTPGKKYYIQNNGSLDLTPDDPSVVGGRALTSTSLLITHA